MAIQAEPQPVNEVQHGRNGLSRLTVSGFKSILNPTSVRVAPLTVLAGVNSSGKSSMMQPILLMKQTLESSYDPGALLLHGPNVHMTSAEQVFSRCGRHRGATELIVSMETTNGDFITSVFGRRASGGIFLQRTQRRSQSEEFSLEADMKSEDILRLMPERARNLASMLSPNSEGDVAWVVERRRCFLDPAIEFGSQSSRGTMPVPFLFGSAESAITDILHLPGLRETPIRTYPITGVGRYFPGIFSAYVASIISEWQDSGNTNRLDSMNECMETLNLAVQVHAERLSDTEVELKVSRARSRSTLKARDYVSIADVGLGVSQALPVIVALVAAYRGQTVYIEQPEIHLHPKAQFNLAKLLVHAANRGIRVIVETHSSITLLGIQAEVAGGNIKGDDVVLHWFDRDKFGVTSVTSRELNVVGAFGDWPEDFSDVYLHAQSRYLDAVEKQLEA